MVDFVEKQRVEDIVEEARVVFASSRAIRHEVHLADHRLDLVAVTVFAPVKHQIDRIHGA